MVKCIAKKISISFSWHTRLAKELAPESVPMHVGPAQTLPRGGCIHAAMLVVIKYVVGGGDRIYPEKARKSG